jgi:predicted PurR-regulated permease PerM
MPASSESLTAEHLYKAVGLLFLLLVFYAHFDAITRVMLVVYASAILAVALNALVGVVPKHRRLISVALGVVIFGGLGVGLWVGIPALASQLRGLTGEFPRIQSELQRLSEWIAERTGLELELYGEPSRRFLREILTGGGMVGSAWGMLEGLFLPLVILIGALYAVATPNERLLSPLLHVIPRERRDSFRQLLVLLGERLQGWVKGTLLGMLAVGLLTTIALSALGVRFALLLGLIAALLEVVPILGPWVSGAIAAGIAFLDDPTTAIWVVLLMFLIQQIEINLITPLVMAQVAEVHPFITLFALIFFGTLFGFLGVILALPLVLLVWTVVEVLWVDRAMDAQADYIEPLVKEE